MAAVCIALADIATPGILAGMFRTIRCSFATGVVAVIYTDTNVRTAMLAEPFAEPFAEAAEWAGLELVDADPGDSLTVSPG